MKSEIESIIDSEEDMTRPQSVVLDSTNPLFTKLPPEKQEQYLRFQQKGERLIAEIKIMSEDGKLPVAHGTSSNYLSSILENGLGGVMPEGALAKSQSVTDATTEDGVVGAYLFAKGSIGSKVSIKREEVDPSGDILKRYTNLSPNIPEDRLRSQIENYFQLRTQGLGKEYEAAYPVLIIANATNPEEISSINPNVPSEREFSNVIPSNNFEIILVPEAKIFETNQKLEKNGLTARVGAIESLELF